jgi:tetratricopeptide (TPR) repeat protein
VSKQNLELEKARQMVMREIQGEQAVTIVSFLLIGSIPLALLTGAFLLNDERSIHSLHLASHAFAVFITCAGLVSLSVGVIALVYNFITPYNPHFRILHEIARWHWLGIAAPFGIFYPPLLLSPWAALQARFAYEGRFKIARILDAFGDFVAKMSPPCYRNMMMAHRAEIHFHGGDYKKGFAMAETASNAAKALYEKEQSSNNLLCYIVTGSTYAALLGLQERKSEGEHLMDRLVVVRSEIDTLPLQRQAEAFSYLAYGCVHLDQFDRALEFSELAAAAYEKSGRNSPPLAGCIAEHWALAALGKGDVNLADEQARQIQKYWTPVTSKTAERQADSYYVLGKVAEARGQTKLAQEQLAMAIAIRQIRNGDKHPELLKYQRAT